MVDVPHKWIKCVMVERFHPPHFFFFSEGIWNNQRFDCHLFHHNKYQLGKIGQTGFFGTRQISLPDLFQVLRQRTT